MSHTHTNVVVVAAEIIVLLLAISGLISLLGGWFFLARAYPDRPITPDKVFSSTSAYFGRVLGGYRMCISVGVSSLGIRFAVFPVFRFLHPPIFIPWSQITNCSRCRFLGLRLGLRLDISKWPRPVYLYGFLGKYGDACEAILQRCQTPKTT